MKSRAALLLSFSIAVVVGAVWPIMALAATQPRPGTATSFAVLTAQAVSNTGSSTVNGDVGLSPNGSSSVTGFPPGIINGGAHHADVVAPHAQNDLTTAYSDAANETPFVDKTGVNFGGQNLTPGTHPFSSLAQLTGPLTLSGFGTYVFQIGSTLNTVSASSVVLTNGAQVCGVFWQVTKEGGPDGHHRAARPLGDPGDAVIDGHAGYPDRPLVFAGWSASGQATRSWWFSPTRAGAPSS
jgi:hypothetical protein